MTRAEQSTRPLVVTIVALFIVFQMVIAAWTWLNAVTSLGITSFDDLYSLEQIVITPDNVVAIITAIALPPLEIFAVVVIFGLLKMKWWALTGAMLLEGLILTLALLTFLRGDTVAARNVISVINVILLNQLPVRRAFGEKAGPNE
jgi:preprotein translocase subunit Sec61beta